MKHRHTAVLGALACVAGLMWWHHAHADDSALVVYCAHDATYAAKILETFERDTGIHVVIRFDTEGTKSLALTELIARESPGTGCDVFWNNEPLGTMRLHRMGRLAPYRGDGHRRIPDDYKDANGHWTGFAARLRVWIINTDQMSPTPPAIATALCGDLSRMGIAKPLYGTTRMHYTVLWNHLGPTGLRDWHQHLDQDGVRRLPGNAHVKNQVARGTCAFGLTDTDDYFAAHDMGRPVAAVPFRLQDDRVICIPNTVAIIKGTPREAAARRLVDYLLSENTEIALAGSRSRQIPLGPVDETKLSDEVQQLRTWANNAYPIRSLAGDEARCLAWIKKTITP